MIKFTYTIFYVKDVERSISFYERAFGLARRFIAENNEYGELITGDTTLSFASFEMGKKNLSGDYLESSVENKPFGMEIGFTTADVEHAFDAAIQAGAVAVEKAKTKPWGQTVAYLRDPDGFLVEIYTPMG